MCLGTAGASLNVDETVARISRVGKHAAKFEISDDLLQPLRVGCDGLQGIVVAVGAAQVKQLLRVSQSLCQQFESADGGVERFFFAPQFLRAFGVAPERRVFEGGIYFLQAGELGVKVKDTSASLRCGL